jgi:hypothetical protein
MGPAVHRSELGQDPQILEFGPGQARRMIIGLVHISHYTLFPWQGTWLLHAMGDRIAENTVPGLDRSQVEKAKGPWVTEAFCFTLG